MSGAFPFGHGTVAGLLRQAGFQATGLGPVEGWLPALRGAVQLMLDSGPPAALLWGPGRAMLYNDAAAALLGPRHPSALGRQFRQVWPNCPSQIATIVDEASAGQPVGIGEVHVNMLRPDGLTELTFAISLTPLRDGTGAIAGVLATSTETGSRLVSARADQAAVTSATPPQPIEEAAAELTVLVVEDDALILESVTSVLRDAGHKVVASGSSEEAIATLADHAVDVLLTDLNLPGASGATLAATALRLRPDIGIILATGDAHGAGHVAVPHRLLAKPFTPAQLTAALADFRPLPPPDPTVWIAGPDK